MRDVRKSRLVDRSRIKLVKSPRHYANTSVSVDGSRPGKLQYDSSFNNYSNLRE